MKDAFPLTHTIIAIALAGGLIVGATIFSNRSTEPHPIDVIADEDIKAEIAILKTSLDNLYKDHNALAVKYSELLEYTKSIASSNKNVGSNSNNSSVETKITNLDNKIDVICRRIFNYNATSRTYCPPGSVSLSQATLEARVKKLEGGY